MQIKSKQVAIVSFVRDFKNAQMLESLGHPTPRVISYAVTLDPERISPSGDFIRFGQWNDNKGAGDEITGWILLEDLSIDEILAEHDGEAFRPAVQSAQRAA
jgi:hypothetical protein